MDHEPASADISEPVSESTATDTIMADTIMADTIMVCERGETVMWERKMVLEREMESMTRGRR